MLGALLAHRLADAGARLALSGRDPARLAAAGTKGELIVADLTAAGSPEQIIERASRALGGLDGVIIAAGVVGFDDADDPDLQQLFTVNALAPIRVIRAATPALIASSGEGRAPFVLTLSGIVSELPTAGIAAYSASKSALAAYVRASARALKRKGVRLIDARPGHTETGLAERAIFGTAPNFPAGHSPADVVSRIVTALASTETDLPSTAFTAG